MCRPDLTRGVRAFTLIELLVVIAIIAVLVGLLLPALASARRSAVGLTCAASMRSVGQALHLYADDQGGDLPLCDHAGGFFDPDPIGSRLATWRVALAPYLGAHPIGREDLADPARLAGLGESWRGTIESVYRCGADGRGTDPGPIGGGGYDGSYGMNVYFVLTPGELDPARPIQGRVWRRRDAIPRPTATIAFGEVHEDQNADHFMAHFWARFGAPSSRVAKARHGASANYLMLDGRVSAEPFERTFDPSSGTDAWNPAAGM